MLAFTDPPLGSIAPHAAAVEPGGGDATQDSDNPPAGDSRGTGRPRARQHVDGRRGFA